MNPNYVSAVRRVNELMQAGDLVAAENICRQILPLTRGGEVPHLLGLISARSGRLESAASWFLQATAAEPRSDVYLSNLGAAYAMLGKADLAAEHFRAAISIRPSLPELHYNLGNALKDQRNFEASASSYKKALQLKPNHSAAWSNLGGVLIEQGKVQEALAAINRALSISAGLVSAHANLATIRAFQGAFDAAIQSAQTALAINAQQADMYRLVGGIYLSKMDYARALGYLTQAVKVNPKSSASLYDLANAQIAALTHADLAKTLRQLLDLNPRDALAWRLLGMTEFERGNLAEGRAAFDEGLKLSDDIALRVRAALSIPPIVQSHQDILAIRAKLSADVDTLLESGATVEDPYTQNFSPNFYLAYHGLGNKELHVKISELYRKLAPSLNYIAPHCVDRTSTRARKRVGFFSKHIYRHSVAKSFAKVVVKLSQDENFDVYIISPTDHEHQSVKEMYADYRGTFVYIPYHLRVSYSVFEQLQLDALIYLDLGMEPFSYLLAHARLAPVQCLMAGHPDTSGISSIDYFLSGADMESPDADSQYSEKLVRLPSGGFSFTKPSETPSGKDRKAFGLPAEGSLYVCPMMLQKLHPDFDQAVALILEQDSEGHVVFFESPVSEFWGTMLRERLSKTVAPNFMSRVLFVPWVGDAGDFLEILRLSDVVLDPFHFGIGSTGAQIVVAQVPIVTLPTDFLRGRVGQYYCKIFETPECIAADAHDYVRIAINIAKTPTLRSSLAERIGRNGGRIFSNHDAAYQDLSEFLLSTC